MTTKELIRAEIERLIKENDNIRCDSNKAYCQGYGDAFVDLLSFLGTLPDEPVTDCHDLEEAAVEYVTTHLRNNEFPTADSAFKAGAEWQKAKMLKDNPIIMPVEDFQALIDSHAKRVEIDYKEKMLKEAVEGFIFQSEDYYPKELIARYNGELKHGDKVKIIIVKED